METYSSSSRVTSEQTGTGIKRVIDELTRGRDITDQLRAILRDDGASSLSAGTLVQKILDSFAESISILISAAGCESDEIPAAINSPGRKSEASGESCKTTPVPKDRRGCYKRRRTSETETRETPTLFEDGHAWRKYGQKVILNAKHPRNYFRCTHKFDQGCQATKQVQKIQDDPPLFRTIYLGHHTCKNLILDSPGHQIILGAAPQDSSVIWSFQSHKQEDYKPMVSYDAVINPAVKQEGKEVYQSCRNFPSGCAHDYNFISPEFLTYDVDESVPLSVFSSGSDRGDVISSEVYSCTGSTHSTMDMADIMAFEDFPEF